MYPSHLPCGQVNQSRVTPDRSTSTAEVAASTARTVTTSRKQSAVKRKRQNTSRENPVTVNSQSTDSDSTTGSLATGMITHDVAEWVSNECESTSDPDQYRYVDYLYSSFCTWAKVNAQSTYEELQNAKQGTYVFGNALRHCGVSWVITGGRRYDPVVRYGKPVWKIKAKRRPSIPSSDTGSPLAGHSEAAGRPV